MWNNSLKMQKNIKKILKKFDNLWKFLEMLVNSTKIERSKFKN